MERFKNFHDDLFEAYRAELSGQSHLVDKMKNYWLYFFKSFENGETFFKKIKKANTLQKYMEIVGKFLGMLYGVRKNVALWSEHKNPSCSVYVPKLDIGNMQPFMRRKSASEHFRLSATQSVAKRVW